MRHPCYLLSLALLAAGVPGAAMATSYDVVTVERPESVEAYHQAYKAGYDICASTRQTLKLPPPAPMLQPPANTRAAGRARAVAHFQRENSPYVINWDSIACETHDCLVMSDPFKTYVEEVDEFVREKREPQM